MDKTTRYLALVFGLVLVTVIGLVFFRHHRQVPQPFLISISPSSIQHIELKTQKGQIVLQKRNGHWENPAHLATPIDGEKMAAYLVDITQIPIQRRLNIAENKREEMGVTSESSVLTIQGKTGGPQLRIGGMAVSQGMKYVAVSGDSHLYLVDANSAEMLIQSLTLLANSSPLVRPCRIDPNQFSHLKILLNSWLIELSQSNGLWLDDVSGKDHTSSVLKLAAALNHCGGQLTTQSAFIPSAEALQIQWKSQSDRRSLEITANFPPSEAIARVNGREFYRLNQFDPIFNLILADFGLQPDPSL